MSESTELKRTALHEWHEGHGGRMVDFAGWSLPVFYETGALAEHHGTRASVGLFDIDHMGQVEVTGPDAGAVVDRLVSSDMASLADGSAQYGLLCNESGGVIDDVIVYRTGAATYLVVVNAGNRESDAAWIEAAADGFDCTVVDRSDELEMIAVQGPHAVQLVDGVTESNVEGIERFSSETIELFGTEALVGRTGYTGEDGVELFVHGGIVDVWTGLLAHAEAVGIDAMAVGLSARDSLRFEPGYPLYGHELGLDITPFEARLGWAVHLDGVDFIGKEALVAAKAAGLTRRLETLVMEDKGVPREGSTVLDADGNEIATVVSGIFAPTVDAFVANAFLPREHGEVGTALAIDIRGTAKAARVAKRPLYRSPSL